MAAMNVVRTFLVGHYLRKLDLDIRAISFMFSMKRLHPDTQLLGWLVQALVLLVQL